MSQLSEAEVRRHDRLAGMMGEVQALHLKDNLVKSEAEGASKEELRVKF